MRAGIIALVLVGVCARGADGARTFVTYEGLPSDFYLKLVGRATRMLRGEVAVEEAVPEKP